MSGESQPIDDPAYWRNRLKNSIRKGQQHRAIYICTEEEWVRIAAKHRTILERVILPNESILDAGCGWGRLLELLPKGWSGDYVGIDLSPDFIELAEKTYPDKEFITGPLEIVLPELEQDVGSILSPAKEFDWCILISMRPMIIRNSGDEAWNVIEGMIRKICKRILYLEYDARDEGVVEVCP